MGLTTPLSSLMSSATYWMARSSRYFRFLLSLYIRSITTLYLGSLRLSFYSRPHRSIITGIQSRTFSVHHCGYYLITS